MKISVIDTETTGLIPGKHDLIQIGILVWDTQTNTTEGYLINHEYKEDKYQSDESALKINGYYPGKWGDTDCNRNRGANFVIDVINNTDILVCHNTPFDSGFIKFYIEKYGINRLNKRTRYVDTTFLSMLLNIQNPDSKWNLDHLIKVYNETNDAYEEYGAVPLSRDRYHNAFGDCYLTLMVLHRFLGMFNNINKNVPFVGNPKQII